MDLSKFDTTSLENIKGMFNGCSNLKEVDFSNFKTSKVKNMANMFHNCKELKTLDLSEFDTTSVTTMENMFYGCEKLKSLNLSNFDTAILKNIDSMFYGCVSLNYLDMSNFDFRYINSASDVFNGADKIRYINLDSTNGNSLIRKAFEYFNYKDYLIVCQIENIIQNPNAIYSCCDLSRNQSKCDYNNYITAQYGEEGASYSNFKNYIPSRDEVYLILYQDSILKNDEPFMIEPNNSIDIMFFNVTTTLDDFFNNNYDWRAQRIIYLDLSHFNSSLLNSTKSMLKCASSLKEINFTNFQTSSVTDMEEMFYGCTGFESLDLSSFDTSY